VFLGQSEKNKTLLFNKPKLGEEGGSSLRLHSGYQDNDWHEIENINWYTEISDWLINYH